MGRTIKWERLSGLRTPALMILGLIAGIIGAFRSPWGSWLGWLAVCAALIFVAYVTDTDEGEAHP
jgi:hypothetical protein